MLLVDKAVAAYRKAVRAAEREELRWRLFTLQTDLAVAGYERTSRRAEALSACFETEADEIDTTPGE